MSRVSGALRTARGSRVARNAGWVLSGELVTLVSQVTMFILVTHRFEDEVFGTFAGVVALAFFVSPFSSFGAGYILVQRVVSRRDTLASAVARAWVTAIAGAVVFGAVLVALQRVVIPQSPMLLLIELLCAELLFNQVVQVNRFVGQAIEKLWLAPVMTVTFGVSRVALAVWYLGFRPNPTIVGWGFFYAMSSAFGGLIGAVIILRIVGDRVRAAFPTRRDLADGLAFSINVSSAMLKGDADKFLLARMSQEAAAGVYSAGYRILGIATIPNVALGEATYARFFSAPDARTALALAKKLALVALVINSVLAVGMMIGASTITGLLGDSYAEAADVIQWIAFIPVIGAWQLFAGNALSGIGHHRTRLIQTLSSAVLNIALNIILIPSMSWRGSALATIITELYLVILHWRTLWRLAARSDQPLEPLVPATT